MADPNTTYRTDRHRRRKPMAPNTSMRDVKPLKARHTLKTYANIQREAKNAPWLRPIAEAIARARLDLLNQDDWNKDIGWAEDIYVPQNPHPDLFQLGDDGYSTTADADIMEMQDPEKFKINFGDFLKFTKEKDNSYLRLLPMTREDAEKAGKPWYQSTDEYLNALRELGYDPNDVLRELAQTEILRQMGEDIRSGDPQYVKAMRHLLDDDEYEPSDDPEMDYLRLIEAQRNRGDATFDRPSGWKVALDNTFAPISSRVSRDPELNHKTGLPEKVARGAADLLLNAGYILGPEWLTTQAALRTGIGGGRLLTGGITGPLARTGTRFAAGGAVGAGAYGYKHGLDPVFEHFTGTGTSRAPVDVRDLGLEALLGGATNVGFTGLLRGGKTSDNAFKLREMIAENNPSAVDYGDIADMFQLMKKRKLKDVPARDGKVRREEITNVTGDDAKKEFVDLPIDRYREKFGTDEAVSTESFPPLLLTEDFIPGVSMLHTPIKDMSPVRPNKALKSDVADPDSKYFGFRQGSGSGPEGEGVWSRDFKGYDVPTEPHPAGQIKRDGKLRDLFEAEPSTVMVRAYEKASDPRFANKYFDYNIDFFKENPATGAKGFSREQKEGVKKLMDKSQVRGSEEQRLFSGQPTVRGGKEYAGEVASARGHLRDGDEGSKMTNSAKAALLEERSRFGKFDKDGNFVKGTKKQSDALRKSTKKSIERSSMNVKGKSALNKQRDYQREGYGRLNVGVGSLGRLVGQQAVANNANIMSNFIPYELPDWATVFGPRATPIEYED